jgi:hypothetical protein
MRVDPTERRDNVGEKKSQTKYLIQANPESGEEEEDLDARSEDVSPEPEHDNSMGKRKGRYAPGQEKIISIYLQSDNPVLSHTEIADACFPQNEDPADRLDFVSRQIQALVRKDLLQREHELPLDCKYPGRNYYRLKRDLVTLKRIYDQPSFRIINKAMMKSAWVQDLLIREKLLAFVELARDADRNQLEKDIKSMLELSEVFFEFALKYNPTPNLITTWLEWIETPLPSYIYFSERMASISPINETREKVYPPYLLYNFFIFCLFKEYGEKYLRGELNPEIRNKVKDLSKYSVDYRQRAHNYQTAVEIIDALLKMYPVDNEGNLHPIENQPQILNLLRNYRDAKTVFLRMREEDRALKHKLDDIYNRIANSLTFKIKR